MKNLAMVTSLAFYFAQAAGGTISPSDAVQHAGEKATVCGQIEGKHTATSSKGEPTFYDMGGHFPNNSFTVLIWEHDRAAVGDLPSDAAICVTGQIELYKGKAEIVLRDSKSWKKQ